MCQGKRKGVEVGDAGGSLVLEVWLCNELMLSTLGRLFDLIWQLCCGKTGQGEQEMLLKTDFASGQNFNAVNDHAKR
jgi:hypothetical protein